MVVVRGYFGDPWLQEKEIKTAIKNIGGSVNQSGSFFSTSGDKSHKKSAVNRWSVAFIPREKYPKNC